jgi:hypothetical protein
VGRFLYSVLGPTFGELTMKRFALLALVAALLAGCGTVAELHPRAIRPLAYSTVADVVGHRFVQPFELDGGGLRVLPLPPSYRSHRTVSSVEQEALSTSQFDGQPVPVGLGVVTITKHVRGIPVVRRLIAWVALGEESGVFSCAAFVKYPLHPPSLPTPGWDAVVIGDASRTPALYYQSADDPCGPVVPTSVQRAIEVLSVPWILSGGTVEANVPTCSQLYGSDFGSTRTSTTFQHLVLVTESNDTSDSATAVPRGCSRHRWLNLSADPEAGGVVPSTIHGPIGPLSQIGTPRYLRGPVQTSAAVIAAEAAKKRLSIRPVLRVVPAPKFQSGGFEMTRSCVLGPVCVAIGWNHHGNTAYLWAARWKYLWWTRLPGPPDAGIPGAGGQLTVSCATAQWCMATGSATLNNLGASAPYSAVLDGTRWTLHAVPSPKGSTDFSLTHVDCLSASWCMATGLYVASKPDYKDAQFLVSEVWNGVSWKIVHIFSPRTNAPQLDPGFCAGCDHPTAGLQALTCASRSFCIVVGAWTGVFVEQWDGHRWAKVHAPDAPGYPSGDSELSGATCTSVTSCVAVGGYSIANGIWSPLVEQWNGSEWGLVPLPRNPHGINHVGGFMLRGVACASSRYCISLGESETLLKRLSLEWNSRRWVYVKINPVENGAIVCLTSKFCS